MNSKIKATNVTRSEPTSLLSIIFNKNRKYIAGKAPTMAGITQCCEQLNESSIATTHNPRDITPLIMPPFNQ